MSEKERGIPAPPLSTLPSRGECELENYPFPLTNARVQKFRVNPPCCLLELSEETGDSAPLVSFETRNPRNTKTKQESVWDKNSFLQLAGPWGWTALWTFCTCGQTPCSARGDFNQQAYLHLMELCPNLSPGHVRRNKQLVEVISDAGNPVFTT